MSKMKHYTGLFQIHGIFTYDEEGKKTDKIPFKTFNYAISNQPKQQFNVNDHAKHASLHSVTITRDVDAASSQLQISTKKADLGDCVVECTRMDGDKFPFVTYTLKNAQIMHVQHSLDTAAGIFQETITISYSGIEFAYIPFSYENKRRAKHTFVLSPENS